MSAATFTQSPTTTRDLRNRKRRLTGKARITADFPHIFGFQAEGSGGAEPGHGVELTASTCSVRVVRSVRDLEAFLGPDGPRSGFVRLLLQSPRDNKGRPVMTFRLTLAVEPGFSTWAALVQHFTEANEARLVNLVYCDGNSDGVPEGATYTVFDIKTPTSNPMTWTRSRRTLYEVAADTAAVVAVDH